MKEYDLLLIGTGSGMNIVDVMIQRNPEVKVAVIDKDEPGGICLTRGCIPSKMLLYSADLVRMIGTLAEFGIDVDLRAVNFQRIMNRTRMFIQSDINMIKEGLSHTRNIDYYKDIAEFIAPYTLKVGKETTIRAKMIILCTGSKPAIPPITGLQETGYLTSDTVLALNQLPKSIAIVGGGYIAAEYGHFFSAMGSAVTIVGRNPQFLPDEEPEVSALAKRELQRYMSILTNHEVIKTERASATNKKLVAVNRTDATKTEVTAEEILVATGRAPNTDMLHPEEGGIRIDEQGWIIVNDYLETSQPNVWALGDANGKYQFKHKANYEALITYYNAILGKKVKTDYHAVPHAIFTYPEVASVGLTERAAREKYGRDKILIGFQRYQDTAKGEAMDVKDDFVKVIVESGTMKVLGAHLIGPHASVLVQEIINLMYTAEQSSDPIVNGMYIHPALTEVVQLAFRSLMTPEQYHHLIEEHYRLPRQ